MTDKLSIIIPMAGLGSRLRPLTWSRPKPLVSLAGATVLDHLLAMFKSIAAASPSRAEIVVSQSFIFTATGSSSF